MPSRRPLHLERRKGVFYFRAEWPSCLRGADRPREVRLSLRTRCPAEARRAVARWTFAFRRVCHQLMTMTDLSPAELTSALRDFGRHVLATAPLPAPGDRIPGPPYGMTGRDASLERVGSLEAALQDDVFTADAPVYGEAGPSDLEWLEEVDQTVRHAEQWFAKTTGIEPGALGTETRHALRRGLVRIAIEDERQFQVRLIDPFASYAPTDTLLRNPTTQPAPPAASTTSASVGADAGLVFAEAVDAYLAAKIGVAWTKRTAEETRRILSLAAEHFGNATPIRSIQQANVRAFRDGVRTWRRKPPAGANLAELVHAPLLMRISAKTAGKYFDSLRAAFNFWVEEGHLEVSPVGKLNVQIPKSQKSGAREPFSDQDLHALFSSPLYAGFKHKLRRADPGVMILRDGFYWIPLVAALSGLRLTEIVQLRVCDVVVDAEVSHIRVRADKEAGQSVKSDAGWRDVPIHPRLEALGFCIYLHDRAKDEPKARVFPDVPIAQTGGGGGEFSKWFGRYMRNLGLHRPGLVFHSFRHRFVEDLRELSAPDYVIKALVGHEDGDVTAGYGGKMSLKLKREWLAKVDVLKDLPPPPAEGVQTV